MVQKTFEATIEKHGAWYVGWIDEVPGAFSQGQTLRELEDNLREVVQMQLQAYAELEATGKAARPVKKKIRIRL